MFIILFSSINNKIKNMEKENKSKPKRKDWKCEVCKKELKEELVLNDTVWDYICKKAGTLNSPKDTLICPNCIERILGRYVKLEELLRISRMSGLKVIVPINYWYIKKHNYIQKATPYIKNHIKTYLTGRIVYPSIINLWLNHIQEPYNEYEKGLIKIVKNNEKGFKIRE